MPELIVDVLGVTPPLAGYARILVKDEQGDNRSLRVAEGHLLLALVQPGERWMFYVADDGETVLGGGFRGEEQGQ